MSLQRKSGLCVWGGVGGKCGEGTGGKEGGGSCGQYLNIHKQFQERKEWRLSWHKMRKSLVATNINACFKTHQFQNIRAYES